MSVLNRLIIYETTKLAKGEKSQGNNYGTQVIKGGINVL